MDPHAFAYAKYSWAKKYELQGGKIEEHVLDPFEKVFWRTVEEVPLLGQFIARPILKLHKTNPTIVKYLTIFILFITFVIVFKIKPKALLISSEVSTKSDSLCNDAEEEENNMDKDLPDEQQLDQEDMPKPKPRRRLKTRRD